MVGGFCELGCLVADSCGLFCELSVTFLFDALFPFLQAARVFCKLVLQSFYFRCSLRAVWGFKYAKLLNMCECGV